MKALCRQARGGGKPSHRGEKCGGRIPGQKMAHGAKVGGREEGGRGCLLAEMDGTREESGKGREGDDRMGRGFPARPTQPYTGGPRRKQGEGGEGELPC